MDESDFCEHSGSHINMVTTAEILVFNFTRQLFVSAVASVRKQ